MTMTVEVESPGVADLEDKESLFNTLYEELHRLARREVFRRGRMGGLGVTTVLHEAYLSISRTEGASFVDHARFLAYAARVMRGLIIDDDRRRRSAKRGGLFQITRLHTDYPDQAVSSHTLARIGDALDELATVEPDLAEVVELKFFCGFSFIEIAAMRGVSERTIQRSWEKGRLYLHHAIGGGGPAATSAHDAVQR